MVDAIADARDVPVESILPGAGSSDLIYLAFREWLHPHSKTLILDPTYGEYAHVLEHVVGCRVDRFPLHRADDYVVQMHRLAEFSKRDYDLIVLVNPNSPTGATIPRDELEGLLREIDPSTRIWVDETYVDYLGPNHSLERFAVAQENVLVCKSMSKVYALSGVRAAYLCGAPHLLEGLRAATPPWCVSLPAQLSAVGALSAPEYYQSRYKETAELRDELTRDMADHLGVTCVPGVANFLLCHLPESAPTGASVVSRCRERGLYLRDTSNMGFQMGDRAVRIAVKDRDTNKRMIKILSQSL
jgi:histidinol-phosphate/aromatic aminotransferase/cobyric acid decarboxylase-like protein